jgi:hypothetical protein
MVYGGTDGELSPPGSCSRQALAWVMATMRLEHSLAERTISLPASVPVLSPTAWA